jgi:ribulose-5-phosphate 4-epimerase/fuculose-1-phosphate aldolase
VPKLSNVDETKLRSELVRACKVLFKLGVVDFIGHLSVRLPGERILIKPRPVSWYHLTAKDLIVIGMDGRREDGVVTERPSVREWPLHAEVYRARPDVGSVLHCHPRDSVLMATLGLQLEPIDRDAMNFPGGVPVWDDRDCLVEHQTMVETPRMGQSVAGALGTGRALILKHHGVVVVGPEVGDVVRTANFLERAAQTHLMAAGVKPQPFMDPALAKDIEAAWQEDRPGFGLSSPSRVVANEQWAMLQRYYIEPE